MIGWLLLVGCTGEKWFAADDAYVLLRFDEGQQVLPVDVRVLVQPAAVPELPTVSQAVRLAADFGDEVTVRVLARGGRPPQEGRDGVNTDLPLGGCERQGCELWSQVELERESTEGELTGWLYGDVIITLPSMVPGRAPPHALQLDFVSDQQVRDDEPGPARCERG